MPILFLPGGLVFRCGNPQFWVFTDKRCNNFNDCGDCSDEIGPCELYYSNFRLKTHGLWKLVSTCFYLFQCFKKGVERRNPYRSYAGCAPCGVYWWPCIPVDFQYCPCIPRCLCRDGRQHCYDWSDEYTCPKSLTCWTKRKMENCTEAGATYTHTNNALIPVTQRDLHGGMGQNTSNSVKTL
ncbi:prolow-density lipoprotein receptor-related protein 1-like [Oncorhynchus masou masou]|uniref:prolow-density lipoprotein receptor-related protein 1-like n=1 Tax=Oncorhynchus masou masou TaxID=90313 RepID=UPI0031839AB2